MKKTLTAALAIASAFVAPASAEMICGRYYGGAHQNYIEHVSPKESKDGMQHEDTTDLAGFDFYNKRMPKIGSCVCAYGVVRKGAFVKLQKIEKIANSLCETEGL